MHWPGGADSPVFSAIGNEARTMGTVHALGTSRETATLGEAAAAYLAALDHPESAGTRRVYGSTVRALLAEFGAEADLGGPAGRGAVRLVQPRLGRPGPGDLEP